MNSIHIMKNIILFWGLLFCLLFSSCSKESYDSNYELTEEGRGRAAVQIGKYHYYSYDPFFNLFDNLATPGVADEEAWGWTYTDTDSLAVFGLVSIQNKPFLGDSYIKLTRVVFFLSIEQVNSQEETTINPEQVLLGYYINEDSDMIWMSLATVSKASITIRHYDGEIISGTFHIEGTAHFYNGAETDFKTDHTMFDVTIFDSGLSLKDNPPGDYSYCYWYYNRVDGPHRILIH